MIISVPKEKASGERRVALVPESCKKLIQSGYAVSIEAGAGDAAYFGDDAYRAVGATVETDGAALLGNADVVACVNAPAAGDVERLRSGGVLLGSLMPLRHLDAV